MSIIKTFETIAAGSNVIYDTSALIKNYDEISQVLGIKNIGHHIPNEVINELDLLAKSENEGALKVAEILFEQPSDAFGIIRAVYIDERYKNESKKIQEVIDIVNNWDVQTYIFSSDNLFKMKVKHLNLEKIDFINLP